MVCVASAYVLVIPVISRHKDTVSVSLYFTMGINDDQKLCFEDFYRKHVHNKDKEQVMPISNTNINRQPLLMCNWLMF